MPSNEFGGGEVVLFQAEDGNARLEVHLDRETVWLNQEQMTVLLDRNQSVISRHIRNVFNEGELDEKSNMQKMHIANSDRPVAFYSLDVIILADNALVALTPLIAESRPDEKDTIVKVIVNLINRSND